MAKNAPKSPTHYKFSEKKGQLGQLFLLFEKDRAYTGVSPNTCELYDCAWKFYGSYLEPLELVFRIGKKPMTVDQRKVEERRIIQALKECRNARIDESGISGVTLNIYLRIATTFINWLRLEDQGPFLQFDWSKALDELKVTEESKPRVIFTPDQIEMFQKFKPVPTKFNQWRAWAIGICMFDCGPRIDEALDLKVDDVEFDNQIINIIEGKGGKTRRVPMNASAHILQKYKMRFIDPYRKNEDAPWHFFGTHDGKKMSQRNALRDLKVILKKSGILQRDPLNKKSWIPKLSFHNYRHTTATIRLENGESLHRVQKLLGHAKASTTALYLHTGDNYLQQDSETFSPLTNSGKARRR